MPMAMLTIYAKLRVELLPEYLWIWLIGNIWTKVNLTAAMSLPRSAADVLAVWLILWLCDFCIMCLGKKK